MGPFVLGAAAGGQPTFSLFWLLGAGLSAFLLRQPATIVAKVFSGRRPRRQLGPALLWVAFYGLTALLLLVPLLQAGYWRLLLLALPGLPVFAWHLWLVNRREERGQPGIEIVAAGVLSLIGPAAYLVAGANNNWLALVIWGISWFQSAASIVHIHLRLKQRQLDKLPSVRARLVLGRRSLAYHGFNLVGSLILYSWLKLPAHIPIAFLMVFLDSLHGTIVPALGFRPSRIGLRQLIFSVTFFIICSAGLWAALSN